MYVTLYTSFEINLRKIQNMAKFASVIIISQADLDTLVNENNLKKSKNLFHIISIIP